MSTYDAVVIGVGHNVLCLAAYLQCRLRTAVVKRRHEQGGGADTEEPVLPAFRHNRHAQCMEFFDVMPMIRDFGLGEAAVRPLGPEQVLVREDLLVHDQRVQPTDLMATLGIGSTFINMNNAPRLADGDAARGREPDRCCYPVNTGICREPDANQRWNNSTRAGACSCENLQVCTSPH